MGIIDKSIMKKCRRCEGSGKVNNVRCDICNGTGKYRDSLYIVHDGKNAFSVDLIK